MGYKDIIGELRVNGKRVLTTEDDVGGSGGQAIIDVVVLPTENINEQALYRLALTTAQTVFGGVVGSFTGMSTEVIVVDELPEVGQYPSETHVPLYLYGNMAYIYLGEFASQMDLSSPWVDAETFVPTDGETSWGGVISSIDEATDPTALYILLQTGKGKELYHYTGEWVRVNQAIIDVPTLPSTGNEHTFYRVTTADFIFLKIPHPAFKSIVVDELPEEGVALTLDSEIITVYICLSDGKAYGYVNDEYASEFGSNWVEAHILINEKYEQEAFSWGGIIPTVDEATDQYKLYAILNEPTLHYYKNGWHLVGGENSNSGGGTGGESCGEPSVILAGHRYYGDNGKFALRNLTGVTRIDWGDGTVEDFDEGSAEDIYTHQWKVNEDVQLPSGFEIRIFGCTKIGNNAFKVQDAIDDLGNQYITTIVIRSGIEDIGSRINTEYVTDNQVTVIMDRYAPPHIISDTINHNSFSSNVTKIIVPSKSVIADYNNYWGGAYESIIQAPVTELPAGGDGSFGEPMLTIGVTLQSNTVMMQNLEGVTRIEWGDGEATNYTDDETEFKHIYRKGALYGAQREIKVYGCYKIGDEAFANFGNQMDTLAIGSVKEIGKNIFLAQYLNRPIRFLTEIPPKIANVSYNENDGATGTTSDVSFPPDVNKIVVPTKEAMMKFNAYWYNTYKSVIQYPYTDINDIISALPIYNGEVE